MCFAALSPQHRTLATRATFVWTPQAENIGTVHVVCCAKCADTVRKREGKEVVRPIKRSR